jgi:hypothetical protein
MREYRLQTFSQPAETHPVIHHHCCTRCRAVHATANTPGHLATQCEETTDHHQGLCYECTRHEAQPRRFVVIEGRRKARMHRRSARRQLRLVKTN